MEYTKCDKSLTELLSHVPIGAQDNAITLQESPRSSWCSFFAVRSYLHSQANLVPHGVHFLQYGVVYVLKQTSYLMVFIFCSTGLVTFSSKPRTSWYSFFAVQGCLRSQANLVPIQCRLCDAMHSAWKNDAVRVSVSFVWNVCVSHAVRESWEPCY